MPSPPRLPSWSATALPGRLLLAVAVALTVLAAGAISVALRTPPTVHRKEVQALAPAAAALDAAGCPVTGRCEVRPELPAALRAAILRSFPAGTVLWQSSALDPGTGDLYQAQAAVAPGPQASLLLTARCLPGSTVREPETRSTSAQQRSDLAGNQLTLFSRIARQVPGAPGCAVTLELTAPGLGTRYEPGLSALAHDPDAQVRA